MEKFINLRGRCVPLYYPNIDTDQIIPKQFLKSTVRTGFGQFLFHDWRFLENGHPNPDFVLNKPEYSDAAILIAGDNFGCGSSREHAPWSILDYGLRAIIAPGFADIFYNNCFKTGLLPIVLPEETVASLAAAASRPDGVVLEIDLQAQIVKGEGFLAYFEIEDFRKHCLLNGLDFIGLTLEKNDKISLFEMRRASEFPFLGFSPRDKTEP